MANPKLPSIKDVIKEEVYEEQSENYSVDELNSIWFNADLRHFPNPLNNIILGISFEHLK